MTKIWKLDDASILRDRRTLYSKETIFFDLVAVVVTQEEIDKLFKINKVGNTPQLPENTEKAVLVFYDGGDLEVQEAEVVEDQIRSIIFKRTFPIARDTIKALLYVPGTPDIPGQTGFNFPH